MCWLKLVGLMDVRWMFDKYLKTINNNTINNDYNNVTKDVRKHLGIVLHKASRSGHTITLRSVESIAGTSIV